MEGKALSFLGTKITERSTKRRCGITLTQKREDRSLNISRNKSLKRHMHRVREPPCQNISPWMKKEEKKVLEAATLPVLKKNEKTSQPVAPAVLMKQESRTHAVAPTMLNRQQTTSLLAAPPAWQPSLKKVLLQALVELRLQVKV